MNKKLIVIASVVAVVLALTVATAVFAHGGGGRGGMVGGYGQSYTGTVPYGGMPGGRGMGMMGAYTGTAAPLHDEMLNAFADALDLTRADVDAQLAKGETMYSLALAHGVEAADFQTFMTGVRTTAIEQAVTNGDLTREQADWMLAHPMGGGRGRHGGMGGHGYSGNCPMQPATPTTTPSNNS